LILSVTRLSKEFHLPANRILAIALAAALISAAPFRLDAQTTSATFGQVISLGGTPSDIVLDESRHVLYLVNEGGNRIDIVGTSTNAVSGNIPLGTGSGPLAAAMSPDNAYLYVTNGTSNTVSVIDLSGGTVIQTVSVPAQPQGIAVGADGRALISSTNTTNPLLVFDRSQATTNQLTPVLTPPPPSTPTPLPPQTLTRPTTTFLSKLAATPGGAYIVGITNPTTTTSYLFVYEVSSGSILRSRTVTGQSTVLAISPDGSRFMAGYTLYDIATLSVLGQMNNANAPFSFSAVFSTAANIGGSVFSPDGTTLYGAFNIAATSNPPAPTNSSTLLISDPNNLAIHLGIRLPESIVAKVVILHDGSSAWSLSQSGLIYLPLSTLYNYPIIAPAATHVFLTQNPCNPGLAQAKLQINNLGAGKLTYAVTTISSALTTDVSSGVAPSTITFTMEPGRLNVVRQAGTNLVTGAVTLSGQSLDVSLSAPQAINLPPVIRVYMNFRNPDQRGEIFPLPTIPNNSPNFTKINTNATLILGDQGLQDIVLDQPRNLVYITNAGYNRIEVFDTVNRVFLAPIPVGQLPGKMALSTDGNTLFVANSGTELIDIVDLTIGKDIGHVGFPPIPRQAGGTTAALLFPESLAVGVEGLEFVMSNGGQWKVVGGTAIPRPADTITQSTAGNNLLSVSATTHISMLSSPDNQYIVTLAGNGSTYLYQAITDAYVSTANLFPTPPGIQGFFGPLGAGPAQSWFTIAGLYTNGSLTVLGGSATPGTVSASQPSARNIVATAAFDANSFVRLTTPVRNSITVAATSDPRPILEQVNIANGSSTVLAVAPENPRFTVFGTTRFNIPPRSMVVDSNNVAYIVTLSGLSVVPLTPGGAQQPKINVTKGVVNANDGSSNLTVGGFVNVNGANLAGTGTANSLPIPTILGGSCVTFNDVALPLLKTSTGQIQAQIPNAVSAGTNIVQVRSLDTGLQSNPVQVTVAPPNGSVTVGDSAGVGSIVPGGRIGIQ
jgi:YVTN family beta-propeller protein